MNIKSTLRILKKDEVPQSPGIIAGLSVQTLAGNLEFASERIRIAVATFEAKIHEHLHWHPIEVFYYVISGSATVRDLEGNNYTVGPGDSIYAKAGLSGSHEWIVHEGLQLLSVRATNDGHRRMQFTVDRETKRSYIEMHELIRMEAVDFASHY